MGSKPLFGIWPSAAALLLLVILAIAAPTFARPLYGDANGDGSVTVADATVVLRIAVDIQPPTPTSFKLGDVMPNPGVDGRRIGDGKLTPADAVAILRSVIYGTSLAPELMVITVTGAGVTIPIDGPLSMARFVRPARMAMDEHGNLFLAAESTGRIRKITPDGMVTTVQGLRKVPGASLSKCAWHRVCAVI
jgi:hypothetical protein